MQDSMPARQQGSKVAGEESAEKEQQEAVNAGLLRLLSAQDMTFVRPFRFGVLPMVGNGGGKKTTII